MRGERENEDWGLGNGWMKSKEWMKRRRDRGQTEQWKKEALDSQEAQ